MSDKSSDALTILLTILRNWIQSCIKYYLYMKLNQSHDLVKTCILMILIVQIDGLPPQKNLLIT